VTHPVKNIFLAMNAPIVYCRKRNARRYILRVDAEGVVRVTIPRGGSLDYAKEFARRQAAWVADQLRKLQERVESRCSEKEILFRGETVPLVIESTDCVCFGDQRVLVGAGEDLRARIKARLWSLAKAELPGKVMELALQHGLQVKRVSVRDQRSRWGSCSSKGVISLNYRLVQTPEFVRDYVIVHELMHLRQMNHSERFWNLVYQAFPRTQEARQWLRRHTRALGQF
jgi:predicted metal-dependent hydrolase